MPAIVFVPSSKQAQLTAIDLMSYAVAAGQPNHFLNVPEADIEKVMKTIKEPALAHTLAKGVGFIHAGLPRSDRERVEGLYRDGIISALVCESSLCWSVHVTAHLVVVMDTVRFEGKEHGFVDYSVADIMHMIGLASRPLIDENGVAVLLCHSPKKEFLTRVIHSALPVESHIEHVMHEHFNAEVVTKTIENKQDAVDYLTWTFYYRRLMQVCMILVQLMFKHILTCISNVHEKCVHKFTTQNPNYYNLSGTTHRHLSDHLSELVENTLADLEESKVSI